MTFERLLPRQTWLIHKCSDNGSIRRHGFNKGVADIDRLGLTTWFKDDSHMKSMGGYNFAFPIYRTRSDLSKYGKHAVMFQSAAVEVWHHGDSEHQAIFWGPAVDRRGIVCIDHDSGQWSVSSVEGQLLHQNESLGDAIDWVVKNATTYRKSLEWTP
jgi:hypothetical protein